MHGRDEVYLGHMECLKKSAASAFILALLVVGIWGNTPRPAQAATGDILVLMQQLIERLEARRDLLLTAQTERGGAAPGSVGSTGGGSSASGTGTTTTSTGTTSSGSSTASDSSKSDHISCDTLIPSPMPNNKRFIREKVRHGDVFGLISAKVLVRIYSEHTIVRTEMQKRVDMFKLKENDREKIKEDILERYGFTKSMIKTIENIGRNPLDKVLNIMDCTKPTPSLFF